MLLWAYGFLPLQLPTFWLLNCTIKCFLVFPSQLMLVVIIMTLPFDSKDRNSNSSSAIFQLCDSVKFFNFSELNILSWKVKNYIRFIVRIKLDDSCGSTWHRVSTQKLLKLNSNIEHVLRYINLDSPPNRQKNHELVF